LVPGTLPVKSKVPRYTQREQKLAARAFPEMQEAGILIGMAFQWGAKTRFVDKKDPKGLRIVHNFIPVDKHTIGNTYPVHSLDEVIDATLESKFKTHFSADASCGYWAILITLSSHHMVNMLIPAWEWD
jgi:hypothetical protein